MPGTFTKTLTSLMPQGMTLAPELAKTFDWMESQGWMMIHEPGDPLDHWMPIYPPSIEEKSNTSFVSFGTSGLAYTGHWSTPNPAVDARIFEIATTSGDGGRAAIWIDDAGKQWFVHLGHDALGVISDDPLVLLQWLAMGYHEPGALEITDITPLASLLEYHGYESTDEFEEDEGLTIPPTDFQAFLTAEFGTTAPETAHALGIAEFDYYGDEESNDPLVKWIISVTPPPTEEELAYIDELTKMASEMDFDDLTLDGEPKPQGLFGKLKGFFGSNK